LQLTEGGLPGLFCFHSKNPPLTYIISIQTNIDTSNPLQPAAERPGYFIQGSAPLSIVISEKHP
jgi:hypothetical protein